MFCAVFGKNSNLNANIIDELESNESRFTPENSYFYRLSEDKKERLATVSKALMMSIKRKNDGNGDGQDPSIEAGGDGTKNTTIDKASALNAIGDLAEKDLLKLYYERLLMRSNGNIKLAAEAADINPSTFRSRLSKVGVSFKKNRRRQVEDTI